MPGREETSRRLECVERRGPGRWISQRSIWSKPSGSSSSGVAPHVPDVAEHLSPTGTWMPWPVLRTGRAALEAVGRLQADRTDTAVAELLGNLGEHLMRLALDLDLELDGRVELGQRVRRELDVDHRAGDADDSAVLQLVCSVMVMAVVSPQPAGCSGVVSPASARRSLDCSCVLRRRSRQRPAHRRSVWSVVRGSRRTNRRTLRRDRARRSGPRLSLPEPSASAPPTISMISVVIDAWRARFIVMLSDLISSSALSVAAFIAR